MKEIITKIIVGLILMFSISAIGQDLDSLKTDRIDDFRDNMIDWTGQDLVDASFPNSWPIFGSKARMSIGGYVKLDYVQDFDGVYDRYQMTIQNVQVPGDGRPEQSGYANMFARESRFNIDFRGQTNKGTPLRVFVEMDFYNLERPAFNQTPRLRLFYGVYGRLLIGRTWGTGSDLYAVPPALDFGAGDALAGGRRAQVRWEDKLSEKMNYAVGLEMLEYQGIDPAEYQGQASVNLPLLVGRITKSTSNGGRMMLAASIFQLRWDWENSKTNSTALGWGINFSGREYFGTKKHYVFWMGSYGDGWGSNIITFLGDGSATVTDNGLETMTSYNFGGGLVYNLSPVLATCLNSYWGALDPSSTRDENKIKSGGTFHLNLVWSPVKKVNTGIEYMYGKRTNVDGHSGEAHRLQAMIKYILN